MKRWTIRILLLLLLMACALPWFLPPLAEKVLLTVLRQRGLTKIVLNIQRITPWQTVLGPVSFGTTENFPRVQTIVLRYSPKSIWHGQLTAVEITGPEATVVEENGKWRVLGLPQVGGGGTSSAAPATSTMPAAASSENMRIPLSKLMVAQGLVRVVSRGMTLMVPVSGQLDLGDGRLRFAVDLQPRDEDFHAAGEFTGLASDLSLNWRTLTGCVEINGDLHPERWQDLIQSRVPSLPDIGPELELTVAADFRQGVPDLRASVTHKPTAGLLRVQTPAGQAGLKTFKLDLTLPAGSREVQGTLEMALAQAQTGNLKLAATGDEALLSSSAEFKLSLTDFALQGTGSFILSTAVVPALLPGLTLTRPQDPAQPAFPVSGTFTGNFTPGAASHGDGQAKVTFPATAFHYQRPELDVAGTGSLKMTVNRGADGAWKGIGEIGLTRLDTGVGTTDYSLADSALAVQLDIPADAFKPGAGGRGSGQAKITLPSASFRFRQPNLELTGAGSAALTIFGGMDGLAKGNGEVRLTSIEGKSSGIRVTVASLALEAALERGGADGKAYTGRGAVAVDKIAGTGGPAYFSIAQIALDSDLTVSSFAGTVAETVGNTAANGRFRFTGGNASYPLEGITMEDFAVSLPFAWSGQKGFSAIKPEAAAAADSALSFERCEGRGISLKPARFPLQWGADGRLMFSGTLALANALFTVDLQNAAIDWRNGLEATATAIVPKFHLTPEFPLLKELLPQIKGLSFSADAGGRATLDFRQNKLQANAVMEIANGTVSLADKKTEIAGISGTIELPALPELRTAPHQKLVFTSALLGGLPVDGGNLEYQLESPTALFIDQATLAWCGGLVRGFAVHVNPKQGDFDLTLYAENIQMEQLLKLFRSVQGKASGNLYGRLPVSFKAGRFKFKDGFLYAVPGQAGTLALTQPGWLTASLGQSGVDPKTVKQVESALSDLEFSQFRIDFTGEGGGESLLRFKIIGASRKDSTLPPVDLNINVRSPLEQLLNLGLRLGQ